MRMLFKKDATKRTPLKNDVTTKTLLNRGCFSEALDYLHTKKIEFSFDNLYREFKGTDEFRMYTFIQYVLACEPSVEAHLAATTLVLYGGMNFDGDFVLARQHLIDALKIEPNNMKVLEYILDTFPGCPDSTFSDDEIEKFRERFEKLNREKNL